MSILARTLNAVCDSYHRRPQSTSIPQRWGCASVGRISQRQLVDPVSMAFGLAGLERTIRAHEHNHVVVDVIARPHRHAGVGLQPEVFPRAPERLEARDRLGVAPQLRAPGRRVAGEVAPVQRREVVADEAEQVGVLERRRRRLVIDGSGWVVDVGLFVPLAEAAHPETPTWSATA
jgi:hypothetical protein